MKAFNAIKKCSSKLIFSCKKHSPELLIVGGVVGVVTSGVMACKATLKVNDILEETKENLDKIHEVAADESKKEEYTEKDAKKDTTIVYIQTAGKFAKLYGPAIAVGAVSITAILAGNKIHLKRNAALTAAYTAVDKSFKSYRQRVADRFGEEIEKQVRYNLKEVEVEEKTVDAKGKEKTVKTLKTVTVDPHDEYDISNYSPYAKFFDCGNTNWEKNPELNLAFLRGQQNYFNNKLKVEGYVFLNDVYEALGIPKTKAGQVVGWIYDEKNPIGDNYIDFGIYNFESPKARDFVNGYEATILLDFNVDGNIWEKM